MNRRTLLRIFALAGLLMLAPLPASATEGYWNITLGQFLSMPRKEWQMVYLAGAMGAAARTMDIRCTKSVTVEEVHYVIVTFAQAGVFTTPDNFTEIMLKTLFGMDCQPQLAGIQGRS